MASTAQARSRATTKYIKSHTRRWTIQCNNDTDADVIAYLEGYEGSVNALVKQLVRQHIARCDDGGESHSGN